ncbi:hypothetical protein D3C72_1569020 [compost metagenome]
MVGTLLAKVDRYAPMLATVCTRIARNLPSASSASSALVTWSRPCASVRKDSLRSAVHLTGRPTFFEAHVSATSSGYRKILEPKPPPTSGAMMRSRDSGSPSTNAPISRRSTCGFWLAT